MSGQYGTAEICRNGHTITEDVGFSPELSAKYCSKCGAQTIRACPSCGAAIRGYFHVPDYLGYVEYTPPNHCFKCGAAFPWMQEKLAAAKEHAAELEGLDEGDKAVLQTAIEDLAVGGAKTELAASRFKRLMKKAGETVGSGLYKVVVDVASETAKKAITGG